MTEKAAHLTRTVDLSEIHWTKIHDILCRRFKLAARDGDKAIRSFLRRCVRPFNSHCVRERALNAHEHMIVSALSDVYSADTLVVGCGRELGKGHFRVGFQQELSFTPDLKAPSQPGGKCVPRAELILFGRRLSFGERRPLMALHFAVSCAALVLLALLGGLLLYSVAVFLVFIESPVHVARRATNDASIGLALLCFLVGAAGICGRAVSNLYNLARESYRARRRK